MPWIDACRGVLGAVVYGLGLACVIGALCLVPGLVHAQRVPATAAGWSQVCPGPEGFVYPVNGVGTLAYCLGPQANGLTFDGESLPNASECILAQASAYPGQAHSCTNPGRAYFSVQTVADLPALVPYVPPGASSPASAGSGATSQDVDRLVRGLQAVLAGCVFAAGLAGFRLGLS